MSLLTWPGRLVVPVVMAAYHAQRGRRARGQADLMYRDGQCYLAVVGNVPEPPPWHPDDGLGVDLGLVNIAVDSDGETYTGRQVHGLRRRHAKWRQRLQKKGTQSAKRWLKTRRRKEHRLATDVNHRIAKQRGAKAQGTRHGIALEDLHGIRDRITVRRAQRRNQHSGAFRPLRSFIQYKARLAGVPVALSIHATRRAPARPSAFSVHRLWVRWLRRHPRCAPYRVQGSVNQPHAGSAVQQAPASSGPYQKVCRQQCRP